MFVATDWFAIVLEVGEEVAQVVSDRHQPTAAETTKFLMKRWSTPSTAMHFHLHKMDLITWWCDSKLCCCMICCNWDGLKLPLANWLWRSCCICCNPGGNKAAKGLAVESSAFSLIFVAWNRKIHKAWRLQGVKITQPPKQTYSLTFWLKVRLGLAWIKFR